MGCNKNKKIYNFTLESKIIQIGAIEESYHKCFPCWMRGYVHLSLGFGTLYNFNGSVAQINFILIFIEVMVIYFNFKLANPMEDLLNKQ